MKKALLIHGWLTEKEFYGPKFPTASNAHWFPWLSKQLMIRDIHAVAIEMPKCYYPEYEVWKRELERFELDENTMLIGHSCGSGFLVRYLSGNDAPRVGKVVLAAPWLGIIAPPYDSEPFDQTFFEFDIDKNLAAKTAGVSLIYSVDDVPQIQESVEILRSSIKNTKIIPLAGKGHLTFKELGGPEFPEILEEILS